MNDTKRKRNGFTLSEVLIVVAILAVVAAIAGGVLVTIQTDLRQKDLDAKAEMIFNAVQNRLTTLYTGGLSATYDPATYTDGSVSCLNGFPGDYEPSMGNKLNSNSVYYFTNEGGEAFSKIVTEDVLDDTLRSGHIVIEYIPYAYIETSAAGAKRPLTAATVYAVYYSEDDENAAVAYKGGGGPMTNSYQETYRSTEGRKEAGSYVGYYGGGGVAGSAVPAAKLAPMADIENGEKLVATVLCNRPSGISDYFLYTITLSDGTGHSYTVCYNDLTGACTVGSETGANAAENNISASISADSDTLTIVLDDLSSANTRFNQLYGSASSHASNQKLTAGKNITLEVTVECPQNYLVQAGTTSVTANSLFADGTTGNTALILKGRHLQNLHESSGVTAAITTAKLGASLVLGEGSDWTNTYQNAYYNGTFSAKKRTGATVDTKTFPNFQPIANAALTSLSGKNGGESFRIHGLMVDNTAAGLFETVSATTLTIENLVLCGIHLNSSDKAGSFVADVPAGKTLTIARCGSVLCEACGDYASTLKQSDDAEALYIINAETAGGLVGAVKGNVTIDQSYAATVIGYSTKTATGGVPTPLGFSKDSTSGGLVGSVTDSATLTISRSYASCYLFGNALGGLVGAQKGSSSITLSSCYTAGYVVFRSIDTTGAAFVNGRVTKIENCYSVAEVCSKAGDNLLVGVGSGLGILHGMGDFHSGLYYSSCASAGAVKNVYYGKKGWGIAISLDLPGTNKITDAATLANAMKDAGFGITTSGTTPYNLMGQGHTSYPYPVITDVPHFGDWEY